MGNKVTKLPDEASNVGQLELLRFGYSVEKWNGFKWSMMYSECNDISDFSEKPHVRTACEEFKKMQQGIAQVEKYRK